MHNFVQILTLDNFVDNIYGQKFYRTNVENSNFANFQVKSLPEQSVEGYFTSCEYQIIVFRSMKQNPL